MFNRETQPRDIPKKQSILTRRMDEYIISPDGIDAKAQKFKVTGVIYRICNLDN